MTQWSLATLRDYLIEQKMVVGISVEWLRQCHNIRFFLTPTQGTWLNRIECQFTALKKFALENSDFRSHEAQQESIQRYLDGRNGRKDLSLQSWKDYQQKKTLAA